VTGLSEELPSVNASIRNTKAGLEVADRFRESPDVVRRRRERGYTALVLLDESGDTTAGLYGVWVRRPCICSIVRVRLVGRAAGRARGNRLLARALIEACWPRRADAKPELEFFPPDPLRGRRGGLGRRRRRRPRIDEKVLSRDPVSGDLTRLLRFAPGVRTARRSPTTSEES